MAKDELKRALKRIPAPTKKVIADALTAKDKAIRLLISERDGWQMLATMLMEKERASEHPRKAKEPRNKRLGAFFLRVWAGGLSYQQIADRWNEKTGDNLTRLNVRDTIKTYRKWALEDSAISAKCILDTISGDVLVPCV